MNKKLVILSLCLFATASVVARNAYITDKYGNQYEVEVSEARDANYYNQQNLQQLQLQNELNKRRQYNNSQRQQLYQQQNNIRVIEDTTTGGYYQRRKAQKMNGY